MANNNLWCLLRYCAPSRRRAPSSSTYREHPKKAGGGAYRNFDNVYITRILNFNRKPRIRSHNKTINGYQPPVSYIFVLGNTTVSNFLPQLTIIYIWSITIIIQFFMIFFLNTLCGEFMKSCPIKGLLTSSNKKMYEYMRKFIFTMGPKKSGAIWDKQFQ